MQVNITHNLFFNYNINNIKNWKNINKILFQNFNFNKLYLNLK